MPHTSKEKAGTEVSPSAIVAKIREEVTKTRQGRDGQPPSDAFDEGNVIFQPSKIRSIITDAEAHADAGAEVSPMIEFSGLTRKMALVAGKIVVYLTSFITAKQRSFNIEAIRALRSVTDTLEEFDHAVKTTGGKERQLKQELETCRKEIAELKREQEELKQIVASLNKR